MTRNTFVRTTVLLAFLLVTGARAATLYWDGSANVTLNSSDNSNTASQTWLSGGFWDNGTTSAALASWTAGDAAIFGGSAASQTITLGSTITVGNLTFGAGADGSGTSGTAYTVSGGTLTLSSTTITANTVTVVSSTLAGSSTLTKAGSGTLKITTLGTYTGTTTVNAGTLELATSAYKRALATSGITVNSGATLNINGMNILYDSGYTNLTPITANGGTVAIISSAGSHNHFGSLTLNGGTVWGKVPGPYGNEYSTFDANVTVGGSAASTIKGDSASYGYSLNAAARTFTVAVTGDASGVDLTVSSPLWGTGSGLVKAGAGTMLISGVSSYTGATTVNGGTLKVSNTARGTSSMTVNTGATLDLGATNMFVAGHGVTVSNTMVLTANGGTLLFNANMVSRIGNVTLNNGATWTSNRALTGYDVLLADTTTGAATVTVSGTGASTMNGTGGIHLQGVQNFNVADVTGNANTDLTVSMILAGPGTSGGAAGGVTKTGAGTMELTAANTYTGATTVNGGTLLLSAGSLASAVTVNNTGVFAVSGGALTTATTVNTGGQMQIQASGWVTGAVSVASGGALAISGSGVMNNNVTIASGGTLDLSGVTGGIYYFGALNPANVLTAGHTGAAFTDILGGTLATTGSTLKLGVGAGTVATLTSAGGLTLDGGQVEFDLSNTVAGANDRIELGGTLDLSAATTVAVNLTSGALGNGSYPLVTYAALSGDVANLTLTGLVSGGRQSYALSTTTAANTLTLDVTGVAANLVWNNAAATGFWSASATDVNWDNGGTNDYFRDGDNVAFHSPAGGAETVTLTGTLQPASVTASPATGETWTLGGAGTLTGPGSLTLNGAGTLALATTGDNTFTGAIGISNGGTLQTQGYTALAAGGAITLDNGTFEYQGATATSTRPAEAGAGGGTITVTNGAATLTLGGIVSGTGALTKGGPGTLAFTGANTRIGTLTIAEGLVTGTTAASLGAAAAGNAVVIEAGGALDLAGINRGANTMNLTLAGTGVAGSGAVYNSGGELFSNSGAANVTLAADATVASNSRWDLRGDGTLNLGGFTLTKTGTAYLVVKSAAGTAGTVHVTQGAVGLEGNFSGASTANVTFNVDAGASLGAWKDVSGQDIQSPITLNGETAVLSSYGGTWNTYSGTLTLAGGGRIGTGVRYYGSVGGDGNLIVAAGSDATNAAYMTGTHTFTGTTPTVMDLQSGYIEINDVGTGPLVSNAILNLGAGAAAGRAVDLWSGDMTVRGLTGGTATTKIVSNGSHTLRLNTPTGETYDFAGVLANSSWAASTMAVTQQGAGTQTLSGANTYTGATTVNGGTLHIGAAGSLANTAVTVNSGGTLQVDGAAGGSVTVNAGGKLSGTGTITGVTAVQGTVAPGASAGTLTVNNDVWLDSTAALDYELSDLTSDRLTVNGALTLDGTLNVTALGALTSGAYTLITYTGGLTDNGLVVGAKPDARSYVIDTATPNEVRLVISDNTPYAQWWKDTYGVEPPPPEGGDYDGDGTPNGDEFAAKTNPTDNTSYLHLTNVAPAGNDMTVSVFTGGATYDLERTDDLLGSWTDIGDITGNDAIQDVTDTGAATGATWFYRAKVK